MIFRKTMVPSLSENFWDTQYKNNILLMKSS